MRMIGKAGDVIGVGLGADFVELQKGIDGIELVRTDHPRHANAGTIGRRVAADHPGQSSQVKQGFGHAWLCCDLGRCASKRVQELGDRSRGKVW